MLGLEPTQSLKIKVPRSCQKECRLVKLECRAARNSDATCRDLVNEPKQMAGSQEGTASITFLGAKGKEMHVECPKVDLFPVLGTNVPMVPSI